MRPGQNKRMRGRNNNRRGPNPLTRSYESNGPDVKIRGTAAHIAEKYVQLARDSHSSGDPVSAESYLQHAEHYLRLIAAAQQQQFAAQQAAQGGGRVEDAEDFDGDDEFESSVMDRYTFRAPQAPVQPGQEAGNGDQPRAEFPPREPYQPREGGQREGGQREGQPREGQQREGREFRRERFDRNQNPRFDRNQNQRFDRNQPQPELREGETSLPPFITAPVRIPIEQGAAQGTGDQPELGADGQPMAEGEGEEGFGRFPLRQRRRRRRGPRDVDAQGNEVGGDHDAGEAPAPRQEPAPSE